MAEVALVAQAAEATPGETAKAMAEEPEVPDALKKSSVKPVVASRATGPTGGTMSSLSVSRIPIREK